MKTAAAVVARVIVLSIALFVCFAVAGAIVGPGGAGTTDEAGATAVPLLIVCLLDAAVVTHIILRSRWSGWHLMAAVFVVFYGITTFMSLIEAAAFDVLPPGVLTRLLLMGVLVAAPFSVLAVLVLGRRRALDSALAGNTRPRMPPGEWGWKLAVITASYLVLYFTFGYFIAWRNPEVREFYGGADHGSFPAHLRSVPSDTPWLVPLQIVRALLWVALALPVIRMLEGRRLETALAIGMLFGVLMTSQLLLPNPYMPETVRMTHLIETASSNFIFGVLVGWLLTKRSVGADLGSPPAPHAAVDQRIASR